MLIVFYYLIIIPFRVCIGLFPADSCLGSHDMDSRGYITHTVSSDRTMTGNELRFEGMIMWYGTEQQRLAIKVAMWLLDLIITCFWYVDILLRCNFFPLFVHHSDGLSGMKKAAQSSSLADLEARSVQHALHDASGQHLLAGRDAAGMTIAHSVIQAKKAFMRGKSTSRMSRQATGLESVREDGPDLSNNQQSNAPKPHTNTVQIDDDMADVMPSAPVAGVKSSRPPVPLSRSGTTFGLPVVGPTGPSTAIFDAYYCSGTLRWDLLGTLPFDLIFGLWWPELASILRLARLFRAHRIFQYIHGLENYIEFYAVRINTAVLRIIEQLFVLFLTIHIFGCGWFLVGRIGFTYWPTIETKYNPPIFSTIRNTTVYQPLQVGIPTHYDNTFGWLCEEAFTPVYLNVRTIANLYLFSIYYVLVCISTVGSVHSKPSSNTNMHTS